MSMAVGILFLRDARSPLPDLRDAKEEAPEGQPARQEPWRVWLHNDDHTPMEYVVVVLREVFSLGWWKATTTMLKAHAVGVALVGRFPREEAQRLVETAHARARGDGWPLRLSAEPGEGE
jgi:ATP-dependent Clp protease adaptor protein ClpS